MMYYNISASFQFIAEGDVLLNLIFWDFIHPLTPILVPLTTHDFPIVEDVFCPAIGFLHELVTRYSYVTFTNFLDLLFAFFIMEFILR